MSRLYNFIENEICKAVILYQKIWKDIRSFIKI